MQRNGWTIWLGQLLTLTSMVCAAGGLCAQRRLLAEYIKQCKKGALLPVGSQALWEDQPAHRHTLVFELYISAIAIYSLETVLVQLVNLSAHGQALLASISHQRSVSVTCSVAQTWLIPGLAP